MSHCGICGKSNESLVNLEEQHSLYNESVIGPSASVLRICICRIVNETRGDWILFLNDDMSRRRMDHNVTIGFVILCM